MSHKRASYGQEYQIRLKGNLSHLLTDWFSFIEIIEQENDETLLVGLFADQSALRGFLDQVWNLNLTVISVQRMKDGK
jgi:hypothetical protein